MKRTMFVCVVVAVLLTAGCSSAQQPRESSSPTPDVSTRELIIGAPTEPTAPLPDDWGGKDYWTSLEHGVLVYGAAGSSSCPPVIESGHVEDMTVYLKRADYEGRPCTMDYRPLRQDITFADGTPFTEDYTIVVEKTPVADAQDSSSSAPGEKLLVRTLDSEGFIDDPNFDTGETYWRTRVVDAQVIYEAGGAGGCPPTLDSAILNGNTLTLHGTDHGDGPCAESYVAVRQALSREDGSDFPADLKVIMDNPTGYYSK
ncbi:hypothetical protein [Timonella sp. A28]|uniref:hypothetical protein n=1 Tax=Timonella sp. A28 TaxID=3442640 RepID=UPI003EC05C2F